MLRPGQLQAEPRRILYRHPPRRPVLAPAGWMLLGMILGAALVLFWVGVIAAFYF